MRLHDDLQAAYIDALTAFETPFLQRLRSQAEIQGIPIVDIQTAALLDSIVSARAPEKILEIGTAVGYSALVMAEAAPHARILSVDIQSKMVRRAAENIKNAGEAGRIAVLDADARRLIPELVLKGGAAPVALPPPYDIIFLDGPKAHYSRLLEDCVALLRPGGLLIADNVLYHGMLADPEKFERRKVTIVKRLRRFLKRIMHHPKLKSIVLPVGDGVSISRKTQP